LRARTLSAHPIYKIIYSVLAVRSVKPRKFVARRLEGESMAALCTEFGKTGYKIFERYRDCGVTGAHRP
jgi:hypothetical protein